MKKSEKNLQICFFSLPLHSQNDSGCSAVRLAHLVWDQRVPGSNPGTPTKNQQKRCRLLDIFFLLYTYPTRSHGGIYRRATPDPGEKPGFAPNAGQRPKAVLFVVTAGELAHKCRAPQIKTDGLKKPSVLLNFERKEGDSNPRNPLGVYSLSRRASSTTPASFRCGCKYITFF